MLVSSILAILASSLVHIKVKVEEEAVSKARVCCSKSCNLTVFSYSLFCVGSKSSWIWEGQKLLYILVWWVGMLDWSFNSFGKLGIWFVKSQV